MSEFRMPSLGADMEEGTLVEWLVHPGDAVRRGDVIALVETEKGLIEVEIWEDGVVEKLEVPEGAVAPVGAVIATLSGNGGGAAEAVPAAPRETAPAPPPPAPEPTPRVENAPPAVLEAPAPAALPAAPVPAAAAARRPPPARAEGVRASPLARRRAAELGIELAAVPAGEGGVVRAKDVEQAAASAARAPAPAVPAKLSATATTPSGAIPEERAAAMRHAIATAMARSKREIPHYYLGTHVDVSRALAWLTAENQRRPVTTRLLPAALFLKAVSLAVREVPEMNGFWRDGSFHPGEGVHPGVAISLRHGGLVAPALHDADRKSLDEVMSALLDLTRRARAGRLRSSEVADATLTVTNLGDQGVEAVYGVIYPPQVALVGCGRILERPWVVDGAVTIRSVVSLTLAADHRASDGHRGGRFLAAIDRILQEPEAL